MMLQEKLFVRFIFQNVIFNEISMVGYFLNGKNHFTLANTTLGLQSNGFTLGDLGGLNIQICFKIDKSLGHCMKIDKKL